MRRRRRSATTTSSWLRPTASCCAATASSASSSPAGQAVFTLACCAPLRVTAEVDEEDIARVAVGQQVT